MFLRSLRIAFPMASARRHATSFALVAPMIAATISVPSQSLAAVSIYTDRATWETAAGGTPDFVADFSSFTEDTDFKPAQVDVGPFTLVQIPLASGNELNKIDVAPFESSGFFSPSGTTYALMRVTDAPPTTVSLTFDQPVISWGADFLFIFVQGTILDLESTSGTVSITPTESGFFGFVSSEPVSEILFRSALQPGPGENFGMDDAAGFNESSAASLDVIGGQLFGASNVDVGGVLYDVEFLDGTCIAVYDGCDSNSDFTFQTVGSASVAAQALLDQVFVDGAPGAFDTDPELSNGCSDTDFCFVDFPFEIAAGAAINVRVAINAAPPLLDSVAGINGAPGSSGVDLSASSQDTWARWSLAVSPVPGPGFLLAVGLLIMAVRTLRES
jgi:hypothetical protein